MKSPKRRHFTPEERGKLSSVFKKGFEQTSVEKYIDRTEKLIYKLNFFRALDNPEPLIKKATEIEKLTRMLLDKIENPPKKVKNLLYLRYSDVEDDYPAIRYLRENYRKYRDYEIEKIFKKILFDLADDMLNFRLAASKRIRPGPGDYNDQVLIRWFANAYRKCFSKHPSTNKGGNFANFILAINPMINKDLSVSSIKSALESTDPLLTSFR